MQRGFSLVELSIVLVILGLLTGGILAGQSLIRAAELRSITTQEQRYVAAMNSFRDKYFALPGDMTNAQSFWGVAHATPATCYTTVGTGTQTCNGDGDGLVGYATLSELFRSWQHMANAGLIEGSFTGVAGAGATNEHLPGTNCPTSRLGSSSGWQMKGLGAVSGSSINFDGSYGNTLWVGTAVTAQQPMNPLLKTEEAWNIDQKMDDGLPGQGGVTASKQGNTWTPNCATTAVASTAVYALSTTGTQCMLVFKTGL